MTKKYKKMPVSRYGFPQKVKIVRPKIGAPKKKTKDQIKKIDVFREFIEWSALPSPLRNPNTQQDFAKKWGVTQVTLSRWKHRQDFWENVSSVRLMWAKDKTPDVIHALYKNAKNKGTAAEVKLWLQAVEDWSEKDPVQTHKITVIGIQGISSDDFKKLTQKEVREPEPEIIGTEVQTEVVDSIDAQKVS